MKYRNFIFLTTILTCLSACHQSDYAEPDRRIRLSAIVEGRGDTRAPYTEQYPSQTHELHAAVWASTTQGVFPNDGYDGSIEVEGEYKVAKHTKANFQNSNDQLLIDAIYPLDAKDVYFVAMYPENLTGNSLWTYNLWNNNGVPTPAATTKFDGSKDVMFAPQVTGVYGSNKNKPQLKFHHLLTWLRVKLVADSEEASIAWGAVESMTIKSNNSVTVDLSHGAAKSLSYPNGYDRSQHVYFSGVADLNFFSVDNKKSTDNVFLPSGGTPYTMNVPDAGDPEADVVAYVMCAPTNATTANTSEYTITLKTEKRGTIQIPIDLTSSTNTAFVGSTMGKQFTIQLKFKIGENISVSSQILEWGTGGICSGELTE